mmetsp:Transcript_57993/g.164410  ORF Transcript_57993/g.164410 Transcript_57993/m.164410 type:complete len:80 (+) Transcript_57993:150-389(+)
MAPSQAEAPDGNLAHWPASALPVLFPFWDLCLLVAWREHDDCEAELGHLVHLRQSRLAALKKTPASTLQFSALARSCFC